MALATEHTFDEEPLPEAVVLDCDFVVSVLHEGEEFHDECYEFALRLYEEDVPIVYSNLLRMEFWQGWRSAANKRGLPSELLAKPMLLSDPIAERERLFALGDSYLQDFLRSFRRFEVRISTRLLDRALRLMARYNLDSQDACVAACAFHSDVRDVVSLDKHFHRVDGIDLWNNHIPVRRAAK